MAPTILKSPLILAVVLNLVKSLISLLGLEKPLGFRFRIRVSVRKLRPSFMPYLFSDKLNDCAIENLFTNF